MPIARRPEWCPDEQARPHPHGADRCHHHHGHGSHRSRLAKRVNVYFNNEDLGLTISDKTKGHPDRLGADGPRLPRSVPGKVTLVDCTPVVAGIVEHSYYIESEAVVGDMRQVLARVPPDEIEGRSYVFETNRYRLTG